MSKKHIAMGIVAHVDSGKTTLCEALLYLSGKLRAVGRVDHKNTLLDSYHLERSRGITIFSKQAIFSVDDTEFTLLDTPGHLDFSTETERSIAVLDYAVLVISGSEGVQSHTETLWQLLERHGVPTFVFVNKMDISDKSTEQLTDELKRKLSPHCVDMSASDDDIALADETLLDSFLERGSVDYSLVTKLIQRRRFFPCYFGSALKLDGVDTLLKALADFTVQRDVSDELSGTVYKITRDSTGAKLTHVKLTGGSLKVRESLLYKLSDGESVSEKITGLRRYHGERFENINEAAAGMTVTLTGLDSSYIGMSIGEPSKKPSAILEPVMSYRVTLPPHEDPYIAYRKLHALTEEDPTLHLHYDSALKQITVRLMGEVHLEILRDIASERFGLDIGFADGDILYKETIADTVIGIGHFEPLRHYAEVHLELSPLPQGSGISFVVEGINIPNNLQSLVRTHLFEKVHIGALAGVPITDIRVSLLAAKGHIKHTQSGDFREATYRAIRNALRQATPVLLEPYSQFTCTLPQDRLGRLINDMGRMSGTVESPEITGDTATVTGTAPVATLRNYQLQLSGYSGGRGRISSIPLGYKPCHNPEEIVAEIAYNPDEDISNPADSVFCANGTGYTVRWDEVKKHAHLESKPTLKSTTEVAETARRQATSSKSYSDDELTAIFERTYGKIDRSYYHLMTTPKKPPTYQKHVLEDIDIAPEYVLVDGYNIIFAWKELSTLAKDNIDVARHCLLNMLCNYGGVRGCDVIVVFDAYRLKGYEGEVEKFHNITVVYTKEAETADMYIEKITKELVKKRKVRVATSDAVEQLIIMGQGALRVSADMFEQEVKGVLKAIENYIK